MQLDIDGFPPYPAIKFSDERKRSGQRQCPDTGPRRKKRNEESKELYDNGNNDRIRRMLCYIEAGMLSVVRRYVSVALRDD